MTPQHATPPASDTGYETWTFTVRPGQAQRVYLVLDTGGPCRWIEMQPVAGQRGTWDAPVRLVPGRYRARTFTAHQGTFLNCGDAGLCAKHTHGHCPGVEVLSAGSQAA